MKERTYIISKQQQYVQNVDLKAGRYTINYSIRTPNTSHRFAFLKKSGGWQEFEMQNLTPGKWHRKDEAKLSFYLLEDVVAFNLCTSPVSVSSPVMIQKLMLEEGLNASTAKPNELDLLESIEDVFDMEHIFYRNNELVAPDTPESLQQDDYTPEGWDDDPISAIPEEKYVWHSFRQRVGATWGAFSSPTLWSNYAPAGEDVKMIEIKGGTSLKNPDKTGGVSSTTLTVVKHGFSTSIKWEFLYGSTWQATPWSSTTLVVDYSEHASLFVNGVATLRCVSVANPEVFTVVSITAVWDGEDGHSPYIGGNGNWFVWDSAQNKYVDSGDSAQGDDGKSPEIRDGYWWAWDGTDWYNTGVKAEGKDGITPVVTQLVPSVILIGKSAGGDPQPNTFTVRHLDGSGNAVNVWLAAFGSHDGDVWYPIEDAEYASFIVVNVAAYPYKYFVVRSYSPSFFPAPEEIYWSTPYLLSVSVGMYEDGEDGLPGIPGQVPVQKEWVANDRHRNSDEIVDYIYVRGSNSETSYWYQLIDKTDTLGKKAGAAPTGGTTPAGYKAVDWMKTLAVKTLIAEEANLANLIFKEGKLISIKGNTFAGEEINYGEYTEYNFASTTTQPAVDSASWLEIPPSTIRWIRYKKNTGSSWTVKQGGTGTGQWTMQFAIAPEGETWYSSYSANRFWARVKVGGENDYGLPFKFTPAGGYDFIPNVIIDGENGEISSRKMTAGNSGIQGTNNELPAFWAGGTYEQAIAGTAKAIIRHDGSVKFTSAEITGTVNAISGTFNNVIFQSGYIGGFRVSGTGLTNGPDFNNDAYIIFRNDENKTFAGIGGNILPSSSGLIAVARFENGATNNFYGSTNYGVIIEASGASRNIGISLVGDIVMKGALVSIEPTFQSIGYTDSIILNISKYRRFLFTPGTSQYLSVDLPSSSEIVSAFGDYKLPSYWNIEIEIEVAWNASGSIALRGSSGGIFVNNNGDVVNHEDTYTYGIIKMKKGDVVTVRYNSYHGRWQLINHSY